MNSNIETAKQVSIGQVYRCPISAATYTILDREPGTESVFSAQKLTGDGAGKILRHLTAMQIADYWELLA